MNPLSIDIGTATIDDAPAYLEYVVRNRSFLAPFEPVRAEDAYSLAAARDRVVPTARRCLYLALHDGHVVGQAMLDNIASQRVLEKCGFHRIGISPRHVKIAGRWQDHALFAITAEDLEHGER